MPRALTEQEKCIQCKRLLEKGKDIVLAQGIKKVSVDDIARAAGMAKGSFYQHFESKENFLYALIWDIHEQFFGQVERMIPGSDNLRANIRDFLIRLSHMPEMLFFLRSHDEIIALFDAMPEREGPSFVQMEEERYKKLLTLAGVDMEQVKPGVVHNYLHTLYLMRGSELMGKDDLRETFELMVDGLVSYVFGGAL